MYFASDNSGPVHPKVMEALNTANTDYVPSYGADPIMAEVTTKIREMFEAPGAAVYLVATGTAANVLALATLSNPWNTIFCSRVAHIHEDECNAPEFYTGGAKLTLVGDSDKMTPAALRSAIEGEETRGVHGPQRGTVAITQVTEKGHVYSLDELRALTQIAKEFNLPTHLDGARFANAIATLGCSPADMTWRAGIDAVSFGGTKNGLMGVEAVVLFDPQKAWEFELRRKRGAHLFSKHRYLSAQMQAYLTDDLWLETARQANDNAQRLTNGLSQIDGVVFDNTPEANMLFVRMPRRIHKALHAAGAYYYLMDGDLEGDDENALILCRLVCDWSISSDLIDQFINIAQNA